ncbi:MAG: pilus assembly protein N-terminal domain-containing protein [Pseudomonadota bacterium]
MITASETTASSEPVIEYQTTGPLKLAPNMVEIVELDEDAASIILSHPEHAAIDVENSRRLLIRPGAPGVTSLVVISQNGKIIYKRDIVVNERQGKYISIRRLCESGAGSGDCLSRGTYYCPDGCYEVNTSSQPAGGSSIGGGSTGNTGGGSAVNQGGGDQPQVIIQPPPQAAGSQNGFPEEGTE